MAVYEGTKENLKQLLDENEGITVIDFYAPWCGPCKMLTPTLNELGDEGIHIVKIDIDSQRDIAHEFGIMSIPTLIYTRNNRIIHRSTGFHTKDMIEETLGEFK